MARKRMDEWILGLEGPQVLLWLFSSVGVLIILMAIGGEISGGRQDHRAEQVLNQALPALIAAVQVEPLDARVQLKPFWDDLRAIAPFDVERRNGGSAFRWTRMRPAACEQIKTFLIQNPEASQAMQLLQDGSVIAPSGYADMVCRYSTLTFEPRA